MFFIFFSITIIILSTFRSSLYTCISIIYILFFIIDVIDLLYNNVTRQTKEKQPLISDELYSIINENADRLNSCIIYDRDFAFNYFGFKILEESLLKKVNGKTIERPQHMFMRVAVAIHGKDIDAVVETYNLLSERYYIHPKQTLLFAGFSQPRMSSSYVVMMPDDSIDGIYNCVDYCADLSEYLADVSVSVHNIRAKGTYIAGTNGVSNGLVPMLRVFDATACLYGRFKPTDITVYVEPWHADIFEYISLNRPMGKNELRAKNLTYALWVPDLFMRRVEENKKWSLMCPHICRELCDTWGDDFEKLYENYEAEGKFVKQVEAQELWRAIVTSQVEAGTPYIVYKDSCNRKSNQKHIGVLKSSNNTTESTQYTSVEEIAVCTQASIALNAFVSTDGKFFDFNKLKDVAKVVARNLDKIIDLNYYSRPEAKKSSNQHRPIGIGVQGLADVFILLRKPFDSEEAAILNKKIFETIYYAALDASCELAQKNEPYPTYKESPMSRGIFQFDMWGITPSDLWDWPALRDKISKHGVRNSLLVAQMSSPTMAHILGNNESVEPYKSNIFTWKVPSGEFKVVNHHLLDDLTRVDLWDDSVKSQILEDNGSIQNIPSIPEDIKSIYKTVWEIKQKVVLNLAKDRGPFIDQSQSLNVHLEQPTYAALCSMHFYGWKSGLKTGVFKLKTRAASKSKQFGINSKIERTVSIKDANLLEIRKKELEEEERQMAGIVCSLNNPEGCDMCGA